MRSAPSSPSLHCFIKLGDDGADHIAIEVGQRSGPGLTGRERRSEEHQRGEQPTHEHRTSVDGTGLNTTPGTGPRNRGRCVDPWSPASYSFGLSSSTNGG